MRAPSRTVLGFPRRPRTCTEELESLASWQPFPDPGRAQACQTGVKECWRQSYDCLPPAESTKRKVAVGGCMFAFTDLVFRIGLKPQPSPISPREYKHYKCFSGHSAGFPWWLVPASSWKCNVSPRTTVF